MYISFATARSIFIPTNLFCLLTTIACAFAQSNSTGANEKKVSISNILFKRQMHFNVFADLDLEGGRNFGFAFFPFAFGTEIDRARVSVLTDNDENKITEFNYKFGWMIFKNLSPGQAWGQVSGTQNTATYQLFDFKNYNYSFVFAKYSKRNNGLSDCDDDQLCAKSSSSIGLKGGQQFIAHWWYEIEYDFTRDHPHSGFNYTIGLGDVNPDIHLGILFYYTQESNVSALGGRFFIVLK